LESEARVTKEAARTTEISAWFRAIGLVQLKQRWLWLCFLFSYKLSALNEIKWLVWVFWSEYYGIVIYCSSSIFYKSCLFLYPKLHLQLPLHLMVKFKFLVLEISFIIQFLLVYYMLPESWLCQTCEVCHFQKIVNFIICLGID
jgi:hypothetical protein